MASGTLDLTASEVQKEAHTFAPASLRSRSRDVRYRIVVLSPDVVDVVRAAGGWLFDRAWAGCEVTALVADPDDDRSLQILGVTAFDVETALTSEVRNVAPDTLALAAELYRRDARVRQGVLETIAEGMTKVMMWGETLPTELEGPMSSAQHRLSVAARAFKAQALAAAACPGAVGHIETFRGLDLRAGRIASADLVTAS
jgi:hypothetical protein